MTPAPVMTTEEYFRTPETLQPTELVYGALRVAESPTPRHQQAVGAFYLALAPHVRAQRLGQLYLSPLDVVFDYQRALILQPDLLFISTSRRDIVKERVVGAPDMVLEVLSPNPRIGKLNERIEWFVKYGVREIWLLHQVDQQFEIVRTGDGRVTDRQISDYFTPIQSGVLPGFSPTVEFLLQDS